MDWLAARHIINFPIKIDYLYTLRYLLFNFNIESMQKDSKSMLSFWVYTEAQIQQSQAIAPSYTHFPVPN
jgi:hypothetical protein